MSSKNEMDTVQVLDAFGELIAAVAALAVQVPATSFSAIPGGIRPTEEAIEKYETVVYRFRDQAGPTYRVLYAFSWIRSRPLKPGGSSTPCRPCFRRSSVWWICTRKKKSLSIPRSRTAFASFNNAWKKFSRKPANRKWIFPPRRPTDLLPIELSPLLFFSLRHSRARGNPESFSFFSSLVVQPANLQEDFP